MARWATLAEIAGIVYTGCRVEVIEGTGLLLPIVGSVDYGNDGSVSVQQVNRGVKGIPFGLSMVSAEQDKMEDTIAAIHVAIAANNSFPVEITDGIYDKVLNCVPDYGRPSWVTHGKHSEGWYENVTWWFVSHSQGA